MNAPEPDVTWFWPLPSLFKSEPNATLPSMDPATSHLGAWVSLMSAGLLQSVTLIRMSSRRICV